MGAGAVQLGLQQRQPGLLLLEALLGGGLGGLAVLRPDGGGGVAGPHGGWGCRRLRREGGGGGARVPAVVQVLHVRDCGLGEDGEGWGPRGDGGTRSGGEVLVWRRRLGGGRVAEVVWGLSVGALL